MIKLDFGKGNLEAHKELIKIFTTLLKKKTRFMKDLWEYRKKNKILGEIDLVVSDKNTLFLFEMKTNNDLNGAVDTLKHHQESIEFILNRLSKKLTADISNTVYIAVIYELYSVYIFDQNWAPKEPLTIEDFLERFPFI